MEAVLGNTDTNRLLMNMRILSVFCLAALLLMTSCKPVAKESDEDKEKDSVVNTPLVTRIDTNGVFILIPSYSRVELRCGDMPVKSEKEVVLFAGAAFTGAPLEKEFRHEKIAGDHVSNGIRYKGYKCKRNTGAFVYYAGRWKFCYKDYSAELDSAAKYNGAAFAQEMMIHQGSLVKTTRPDGNVNVFRALCELEGHLCIIESIENVRFGDFKSILKELGVTEAVYIDMGAGWNHAWYRPDENTTVELHPKVHEFCTNWITFVK